MCGGGGLYKWEGGEGKPFKVKGGGGHTYSMGLRKLGGVGWRGVCYNGEC